MRAIAFLYTLVWCGLPWGAYAEAYPKSTKNLYVEACIDSDEANRAFCACNIAELERTMPFQEFSRLMMIYPPEEQDKVLSKHKGFIAAQDTCLHLLPE